MFKIRKSNYILPKIYIIDINFIFFLIVVIIGITGCGGSHNHNVFSPNTIEEIDSFIFDNAEYSLIGNKVTILGKEYNSIWQYNLSDNQRYLITSEVETGSYPQIKLYDLKTNEQKALTNNDCINHSPSVNDLGNYAFVSFDIDSKSKITINNKEISVPVKANTLTIDSSNNVYLTCNQNHICEIIKINSDLQTTETLDFPKDLKVTKLYTIHNNKLLIQAYSETSCQTKIYVYNLKNSTISRLLDQNNNAEIIKNKIDNGFEIDCFEDFASLIYAYLNIIEESPSIMLSASNNFYGRLCWNISYKIEFLEKLLEKTNNQAVKKQLNLLARNLLEVQNRKIGVSETQFTNPYGWATTRYSIDKTTHINLMVNDAKVLYPLLRLCSNDIITDQNTRKQILETAIKSYDFFEKDYQNNGFYIFPKGIAYQYDGIIMPWNQQNAFGLCLIEMYKLTNNEKYKNRVMEMAKAFKKELYYVDDRIIWYYWPLKFYDGWTVQDDFSTNTPKRNKVTPKSFEDISHAGINVKFMLEMQKAFPNEIFNQNDIMLLTNTANSLLDNNSFFTNIYEDSSKPQAYEDNYPVYGWFELDSDLCTRINSYVETGNLFFDNENALIYLACTKEDSDIKLNRVCFDKELKQQSSSSLNVNFNNYFFKK